MDTGEINSHLGERLKKTTLSKTTPSPGAVEKVTPEIRQYFSQAHNQGTESHAFDSWLSKPEIPSAEEIFGDSDEYLDLPTNKIDGPWESKDAYLKSHYELLREDAVAPLRDAVAIFRHNPDMDDDKHVFVYEKIHVIGLTFANRGLAFKIQFSTNRAGRNIAWEYSKRLVSGSVVALSPADDAFQTKCVIAIIAARPLEGVQALPPEVDIFFANPADANFDPQLEWVMIEAKQGYYEASRHTMTALQKLNDERFPLSEHICFLNPETMAPSYVADSPIVGINSIIVDSKEEKVDILKNWPKSPIGDLDAMQWAALEQMLTKQLAVIQGPPGTGKTYVSVLVLRIMLSNMKPDDPPIIVASQTNHALDQILTHVSRFERQYVRLGARSSDADIKKRTLFNIRHEDGTKPNIFGGTSGRAYKVKKQLFTAISELLQPFNEGNSDSPIPTTVFKQYGILTTKQVDFLENQAKRWVSADQAGGADSLAAWLGDQAGIFEVEYNAENFGFAGDEVDLEYEQLKEMEAEQGLNDDDDYETLKGTYVGLREGFYGKVRVDVGSDRSDYLDYDNLWQVPVGDRGWVYNELRGQLKARLLREFRQLLSRYEDNCKDLQIGRWEMDHLLLQNTKILGMTTTGLSKYRALISSLKPKIVLIEEAAEAIEGPIAAACLDSLQQLILVGDHQQLRGHCSLQELEGDPYYLAVSMFERLVKNGMKYVTLQRQRRMAPEIRQLLTPIYGPLQDHESVQKHEEVPGMGSIRSFLFSHDWSESFDDMSSKYNEKEAEMIVEFFIYLVLNNVAVKDITVLTFYNGQRKRILKLMRNHSFLQGHYIKVVTVDSYQGEENEVVILSLVRNGRKGIGFLSIANRVCVALSRARRGFYMFGNADLLASDELWAQVLRVLGNKNPEPRIGHEFPLTCVKHKSRGYVKEPEDWRKINGGCELACGEKLSCGHKCTMRCHIFPHEMVQCKETCNRQMACKHFCKTSCATMHTCNCDCEESKRLEALAEAQTNTAVPGWVSVDTKNRSYQQDSERRSAIESYRAYAQGASKEHDARLEQIAEMEERMQPVSSKVDTKHSTVPSGARDTLSFGDRPKEAKPDKQPEMNLIDFW
ncbi:P-loop containing nucleoside triphosphate hydrolase protein [Aspergillus unguis]